MLCSKSEQGFAKSLPHLRWLASESSRGVLLRWLQAWDATPPVPEHVEAPTALSWLRRRGPHLPEALVRKLFRQEIVRVYDPVAAQVRRAGRDTLLHPGARLLVPKGLDRRHTQGLAAPATGAEASLAAPAAQRREHTAWVERLQAGLLHSDDDLLAINKPAGLAVQGGSGLPTSVDALMREAFGRQCADGGAGLRLVHRLDMATTGVLLLGKTPDAAAWLGEAFCRGAEPHAATSSAKSNSSSSSSLNWNQSSRLAPWVRKEYWALVDCSERGFTGQPQHGTINLPVGPRADAGSSNKLAALTHYRVRCEGAGLALLQLHPLTGRKHQLRIHLAHGLGRSILGDDKYAPVHSSALQQEVWQKLRLALTTSHQLPLFLHCRGLTVRKTGDQRPLQLLAPLPPAWRHLMRLLGWPLPADSCT